MTVALDGATLAKWRADPLSFLELLHDPETGRPFVLNDAQRAFLERAFMRDADGRLVHSELVFGAIKKSGKTTTAALVMLVMVLLFGGRFAEGYCLANDFEQAQSRVFEMVKRVVEASPPLLCEARITSDRIVFPALDAAIVACASDHAGLAGAAPTCVSFDELWGYVSERSRRVWDELAVPVPTRKVSCRLTTTYAGYVGESVLLEELHRRGRALPQVGDSVHAGDGMLFAWHTKPIAPWQTERWLEQMRATLRPSAFQRMVLNEFTAPESSFVNMREWDECVVASMRPTLEDHELSVWAAVDASVKRDATAIVGCTCDRKSKLVRLVNHKVFTPTPGDPIDFEATVEATLIEWSRRYRLRKVLTDPFQMAAVMQRLQRAGVKVEEYPQTMPNLTAAVTNLLDLVQARGLALYPDAGMRLAASRAIIIESSRGFRLDKMKQSHHIDVVVALSMAALAAVRGQGESTYDDSLAWVGGVYDWRKLHYWHAVSGGRFLGF